MILKVVVGADHAGMRLDDGAKELFPQLSKTQIRRIIDWGGCTICEALVRVASRPLREGDLIALGVMEPERCVEISYRKEDLLFEDANYLAVNKAAGINSQRTPYQLKGTVEYAVETYMKSLGSKEPARVIHRLDRGTSGVMFFPKDKRAATHISFLLKEGKVEKVYWAMVAGVPDEEQWTVDAPIAKLNKFRYGVALPGREARTAFRVIAVGKGATLLEALPFTGRTHQIRVHLVHSNLPIIGDTTYGGDTAARMMLHCRSMAFTSRDGKPVQAIAPLDEGFLKACRDFGIETEGL
ncbi:RluA family pseudouridine synthase [Geotalea uraniireducens]|uniref:Pseudouridine synthase, RluA family n=1 Tax=Geotalea uraniireducens (strain Rf4) TaxID=351605 RepID=A5GDE8_GEOUR|nr:RluA family pseudouridine synthase [Geotalea uraniireducens]ABQ24391.1 pseudouridine synthase, RluA family [Geotalea uraniireducens Rf4]